jgi:hypothetical protein
MRKQNIITGPRRKNLASTLALLAGLAVAAYAAVIPTLSEPFLLLNLKEDYGVLDGDRPHSIPLGILNFRNEPLTVEVTAPGCLTGGKRTQKIELPGRGTKWFDYPFDVRKMRVGPGEHHMVIEGEIGDRAFRKEVEVRYTIARAGL